MKRILAAIRRAFSAATERRYSEIIILGDGVFVNGVQVEGDQADKIKTSFAEMDREMTRGMDAMSDYLSAASRAMDAATKASRS